MKYFNISLKQLGKVIVLISAIIVLFVSLSHDVAAFSCDVSPDPWFSFRIEFDKSTLPPWVEFITQNEYITGNEYGKFSLKNNGNIPLYLIETPDPSKPVYSYPNSELPLLIIPRHKLVEGKAYYYSIYEPNLYSYIQNAGGTDSSPAAYELSLNQEELGKMGVKVENIYQDDRPASAQPPTTQNFTITAYYGSKPIELIGKVSYSLNKDYDPKASVKKKVSCEIGLKDWEREQALYSTFPFLQAFSLLTLPILGFIMVYRLIKKKSIKKILIIFLATVLFNIIIQVGFELF